MVIGLTYINRGFNSKHISYFFVLIKNLSLNIHLNYLKVYKDDDNIHLEETMSQISNNAGLVLNFMLKTGEILLILL